MTPDRATRAAVSRMLQIPDLDQSQYGPLRAPHLHVPGLRYDLIRHPREQRVDFLWPFLKATVDPFVNLSGTVAAVGAPTYDATTTPRWVYQEITGTLKGAPPYIRSEQGLCRVEQRPEWAVGLAHVTTTQNYLRIGLIETPLSGEPTNGIFFRSLNGGNWFAVTRAAATETTTDTGIAASTTPREFRIVVGDPDVTFLIDGQLRATHRANLPTTSLYPTVADSDDTLTAANLTVRVAPYMSLSRKQGVV